MNEASQPAQNPSYFLISVSTRENLELFIKHGLAGFPSGESGAWTFSEIEEGDLVSFLYGARAHNLYRVGKREAIRDAESLPPWKLLTFRETGRTYSFPFRLNLQPIRVFNELLVRAEFAYVAENLLLRGGYSKTHFKPTRPHCKAHPKWERLPRNQAYLSNGEVHYVYASLHAEQGTRQNS